MIAMVYCRRTEVLGLETAVFRAIVCVTLFMSIFFGVARAQTSSSPVCSATDRDALLRFKNGIVNGSTTPCLSSWTLTSGNCCAWLGVKCEAITGHVVELNLTSCALSGVLLQESLGNVSALEVVDLSNNMLYGDIPEDLLQLRNMSFFSVAANGELPDNATMLSDSPGFNPGTFINGSFDMLTKLTHLDLGQSFKQEAGAFTSLFPSEVCKLKNLTYLNLRRCYLVGTLPDCFGSQMSRLEFLDLSGNDLKDDGEKTMLNVFGNLTNLRTLTVDQVGSGSVGNSPLLSTTGSLFPISSLRGLRNLQSLTLAGVYGQKTKLRQVLDSLQELNQSLVYLDLRENSLTGVIPHSIQAFANLRHLDLGNNLLNSTLTSSIFQLRSLEVLNLDRNQFRGLLPPAIGKLGHLQFLNVTENSLEGPIPEELGRCVNLTSLDLSNNNFNGSLPKSIANLTALRYLSLLSNANLGGDLPTEIGNLTSLEFIDFSHDAFTGMIPWSWGENLSRLRFLHGTTNHLSGVLPTNLGNLSSLISLDLSYNDNITGPLPVALGYLTSGVYRILFCQNQMTGGIPPEWNNLGATLKSLSMYYNNLTGPIPNMTNLRHLEVLDMSYNSFTGAFPEWIEGSRDTLRVLELSQNRLEGTLPSWLSSFTSLQIMNLGGNLLTGSIPEDLSKLTTMTETGGNDTVLWTDQVVVTASGKALNFDIITINTKSFDFNGNKLTGHIPTELGSLQGLIYLSLAGCNLTGTIPAQLANLTNLETLDLSSNQLDGPIPSQLDTGLHALQFLNLTNNNLSGPIPHAKQLETFNSSSFENNPLLCGPPTNQTCQAAAVESDNWDDVIDMTGFAVGISIGFVMMVVTFGLWLPARRWVLYPMGKDLWYNGHFRTPDVS
ncbi:hypothetical protein KC19_7G067000 [Ceratodon purpureus]|uniref:Leucine-rich repeat-containing N-terminal plant-type domain-containing protein n=1 Tax=Ceratodon purpureus TaxID=3225 RepID=A0A8T0H8A1_CERPU|nr:hypothetical protein KC19_7G067000 [Ceratodon purpureus]